MQPALIPAPGRVDGQAGQAGCGKGCDAGDTPPGLPEVRQHPERQGRTGLVPNPRLVAGGHPELVVARRQVAVPSAALPASLNPFLFHAFELAPEANALRRAEVQAGIAELKLMRAGRNGKRRGAGVPGTLLRLKNSINRHLLDDHPRHGGGSGDLGGINPCQALDGREPQTAILRAAYGRLKTARTIEGR